MMQQPVEINSDPVIINFKYDHCPLFDCNGTGKMIKSKSQNKLTGEIIIPNGTKNNIQQCVRYHYMTRYDYVASWNASYFDSSDIMSSTNEERKIHDLLNIDNLFDSFQNDFINKKLKTRKFQIMEGSEKDKFTFALKCFEKKMNECSSKKFLLKLIKHFSVKNIILHMYSIHNNSKRSQPYYLNDLCDLLQFKSKLSPSQDHIFLFLMNSGLMDGIKIVGVNTRDLLEMEDKLFPLLVRPRLATFLPSIQFVQWINSFVLQSFL